jgi:phosphatidylglycerol:prolipoprotein diacylglycerol transferase
MYPKLGELDGYPIHTYGVVNMASAFLCVAALAFLLKARGQNLAPSIDLTLLMILGYTVLARLFAILLDREWEFFTRFSMSRLETGFWGGQIGFGLLAGAYLAVTRAPFAPLADSLAASWALISVPHKVACFMGGCCGGAPSSVPWAVTFPEGSLSSHTGVPVHPTQLYDAAAALLLTALLLVAFARRAGEGRLLLWWGLGYSILKLASEFSRGDQRFIRFGPVTAAMIVEIAGAAVFALLLLKPGLWGHLMAWRERRSAGLVEPVPGRGRWTAFFLGLGGFIAAASVSSIATLIFKWPGTAVVVFLGVYVLWNLLRPRLVTRRGGPASAARRIARGFLSAAAPATFFGLFRPLFDRHARTLGDAVAGTYSAAKVAG